MNTNDAIDKFGTQDVVTVAGGTSAVVDAAFSAAGDVVSGGWINTDDAELAAFALTFQYPSGTILGDGIHLFARLMNIDGTADEPQPDSGWEEHFLGSFTTDTGLAATTDNTLSLGHDAELPNMYTQQVYEFYIKNDAGVTMTAGWTLKITPKAKGPAA